MLPHLARALIGREREHAELIALLQRPDLRLLTLTGPGGTGKTSLALHLTHALAPTFPDGAWFVDLAPVSDIARVAPTIVQALGLPESTQSDASGSAAWARLGRWLSSRRALLLLDNLEQVADIAPQLAGLLRDAAGVQVLATSRLPLRLSQEREYPLAPLPVPHAAADTSEISAAPAVQLFVERAQAVRPVFALTEETAPAVAAICAALDGLPLALELAAARVRLFTPHELAARLERDGGLSLLTRGVHDLPARQQTIRGTIQWSYALLAPAEQRLLARLSVFVGGWTLALAEAVCTGDGKHALDVVDGLERLIEHSLVQQQAVDGEGLPLRLLETVREFAHEQLLGGGELTVLRDRHLAACVALAEEAEPHTRSGEQLVWLARLDAVYDNLRAALVWSLDEGADAVERRTLGLRLAGALWYYWFIRGRFQEVFRWLNHPATNDERLPVTLRAHIVLCHRFCVLESGGTQSLGTPDSARHLALVERSGDPLLLVRWLLWSEEREERERGWSLSEVVSDTWWRVWFAYQYYVTTAGDVATGPYLREALAVARARGDGVQISRLLSMLAYDALVTSNLGAARQLAEEELVIVRRLNFTFGIASALFMWTRVLEAQGDVTVAREINVERNANERLLGNAIVEDSITFHESIYLALWQADYRFAAEHLASLDPHVLAAHVSVRQSAARTRSWLALERGQSEEALAQLQGIPGDGGLPTEGFHSLWSHGVSIAALWLHGTIVASQGMSDRAITVYERSLTISPALASFEQHVIRYWLQSLVIGFSGPAIVALSGLGRIAAYHPDQGWARQWLSEQLATIREQAGIWDSTIARAVWGRARLGWGDYSAAAAQLADDLRFYRKSGARRLAAETLEGLGMCAAQAQPAHAARLWGAAAALRAEIGAPMWPCDRPLYERHIALARVALGDTFDSAWSAGQALTWQQAADEALAFGDGPSTNDITLLAVRRATPPPA